MGHFACFLRRWSDADVDFSGIVSCIVLRMAIWLRGLKRWYLVVGGVAVGRGFEPQSDLELFFTKITLISLHIYTLQQAQQQTNSLLW
jgi:hypothetical protein